MDVLNRLQQSLGYAFRNPELGRQALTHRSHSSAHNERLEFLGDAVLNLVAGAWLYAAHPEWQEGRLSQVRSRLVNREALRQLADHLGLVEWMRLGEGELKGGNPDSIRADAVEALIGALFLDGGWDVARPLVERWLADLAPSLLAAAGEDGKDAKTRLQEWLQARQKPLPSYTLVERQGPDHAPLFRVRCQLTNAATPPSEGQGKSRREAEQQAAQAMLLQLEEGV